MSERKNYLTAEDWARLFGEWRAERDGQPPEEARPYTTDYVRQLVSHSRGTRTTRGRYTVEGRVPMPLPDEGVKGQLIWSPKEGEDMEGMVRRMQHWFLNERPGPGAGGGPKPKQDGKAKKGTAGTSTGA